MLREIPPARAFKPDIISLVKEYHNLREQGICRCVKGCPLSIYNDSDTGHSFNQMVIPDDPCFHFSRMLYLLRVNSKLA